MRRNFILILTLIFMFLVIIASRSKLFSPIYLIGIELFFILAILLMIVIQKDKYKSNIIRREKIPSEFQERYNVLYKEHIKLLEKARKKVMLINIFKIILLSMFVLIPLFFGIFVQRIEMGEVLIEIYVTIIFIMIFGIAIVLIVKEVECNRDYEKLYKTKIISPILKLVNEKLNYQLDNIEGNFSMAREYKLAQFQTMYYGNINVDDYIEALLDNNILVKMSNICISSRSRGKSGYSTLFRGVFALFKINRNYNTYIKISRNKLKIFDRYSRIKIENKEFDRYFNVFSKDKEIADKVLTEKFCEVLIDFYKKYNIDFEIVLKNDIIYLRLFTEDLLKMKIYSNSIDKKRLFICFCVFKSIAELIEKINYFLK